MPYLDDPRVLFAAERTLLAWNRTSLSLMAFGFVIERFGLFLRFVERATPGAPLERLSFWIGMGFLLLGTFAALASSVQYRRILAHLGDREVPAGYNTSVGIWLNVLVAVLGAALLVYLALA